ncbi:MAG: cytochrome P450 [Gammaproteobacteria bacterium]|nr:MAG: cytochrome P450 [Gammaproteobacteria bacterium]
MSTATSLDYTQQPDNKDLDHIPGEYGLPWVGKAIPIMKDVYATVDDHYKRFGPVSRIRMGGQNGLLVVGGDLYQQVYLDRDKNFSTKMGYAKQLGGMYPDTILLQDFDEHKIQRRMFQGAFKNDAMRGYVDMMNPVMKHHLDQWEHIEPLVFFPSIKKTLLDVGATIFVGMEIGAEADKMSQAFLDSSEGLLGLIRMDMPGLKWHKGKEGVRYLRQLFKEMIPVRRAGDGKDTFSFLCKEKHENGEYFSDEEILNQLTFLLFAAHDTTTSALCHMVYYSAQHPEWQQKMREESLALGKPMMTYDDLDSMKITDMVFHESLRLYPSVPLMTRRTIRECELGGYRVPANTILFLPPTYNHHMPEYWTNPDKFDPERFSPARNEHKNHSFCYVPFGGGAHKCIGMHFANMLAKCFMHQFLLKYEYNTPPNYHPEMLSMPLPRPADGIPLKLKKRG